MLYLLKSRRKYRYTFVVAFLVGIIGIAVPVRTGAVEVPPVGASVYIQTNAPNTDTGVGDWYSTITGGKAVRGYHYLTLDVPCDWPVTRPIDIDLFSPEMNTTNFETDKKPEESQNSTFPFPAADPTNNLFPTQYELYAPGTPNGPAVDQPAPGAAGSMFVQTYNPATTPETWRRFFTIPAPVTCGSYILRAESRDDDQNGWRVRFGDDDDADPTNAPPADYDNPDLLPGTGDELTVGLRQVAYQHDKTSNNTALNNCLTLYEYVEPGQPSITFHNFDLDENLDTSGNNNTRVRYYAPSDTLDPLAKVGGIEGVTSINAKWNNNPNGSSQDRVGDTVNNPESGWWRVVTCATYHNQYIQEAQNGVQAYYQQPPTPSMALSKTNGVTEVVNNQVLTYTLTFTNTSNISPTPGAAKNIILTDNLSTDVVFQSCAVNAPTTGTCTHNSINPGGTATFAISDTIKPGQTGSVRVTVKVNNSVITTPIVNNAELTFKDPLKNTFPPIRASDQDPLSPTAVALAGFSVQQQANTLRLNWLTGAETQSLGFHVYRGTTPERTQAGRVSADLIPARGPGSSYSWTDTDVAPATRYYYWLAELDTAGATNEYGPISITLTSINQRFIFIPLLVR